MTSIYYESLSREYKKKLKKRELPEESVKSLFISIARRYNEKKKGMKLASVICISSFLLLGIMWVVKKIQDGDLNISLFGFSIILPLLILLFILVLTYYLAMAKVPMQFFSCLKRGYPELAEKYNFEAIRNYIDEETNEYATKSSENPPEIQSSNSLVIEDTFDLGRSTDIVVVGYLEGTMVAGDAINIASENVQEENYIKTKIVSIEVACQEPAKEASNCNVALRIKDGKGYNIKKGMVIFK